MSSHIRSYSLKTTVPKTVFLNARPLVIPRRVWKVATSAVRTLLLGGLQRYLRKYYRLGCGDVADITNNGGTTVAETNCTTACSGDTSHLCGGTQRLQLYLWNGILNNWQTPTNIGRYEVRTTPPFLGMHTRATKLFNIVPRPWSRTSAACHRR
jgi:hypothetical protein